jgi:hypothetical protein
MKLNRTLIAAEVKKMDQEAKMIISLINDALPNVHTDLFTKTMVIDKLTPADHPIDRLSEYRTLSGKISIELSRLENITSSLRRKTDNLSERAHKLNKLAAWTPELVEEILGKAGEQC